MKKLSKIICTSFLVGSIMVIFAACTDDIVGDPYKDYVAAGIQANGIPHDTAEDYEKMISFTAEFTAEKAKIFTDYESYAAYNFPLNYTEGFFEKNNLLIFWTLSCSSDGMQFYDILLYENKLYPCYSRVKINPGDAVTDDIICMPYYVELNKSNSYQFGEVIYKFR